MSNLEQQLFDLLASLVEWSVRNDVSCDPMWEIAEKTCIKLQELGAERTSYLDDYYESYMKGEHNVKDI